MPALLDRSIHRGVELYVPELGGVYRPKNNSHYTLMTLTGGMSRGSAKLFKSVSATAWLPRSRPRGVSRVGGCRTATRSRAQGSRNPRKAAEGFELKHLVLDPDAAIVVRQIFDYFLNGHGLRAIAARLNKAAWSVPRRATEGGTHTGRPMAGSPALSARSWTTLDTPDTKRGGSSARWKSW